MQDAGPAGPTSVVVAETSERGRALFALTLTALMWGCTPVAIRSLVQTLAPADIMALRFVICGTVFALQLTLMRGWGFALADLPRFAICGLSGVAGYNIAVNYGFMTTPASLGGLILGSEPLIISVLAALILGERLSLTTLVGLLLAGSGSVVLLIGSSGSGSPVSGGLLGPLLILIAATSWAFYAVLIKPLLRKYGAMRATAFTSLIGAVPILMMASQRTLDLATGMSLWQWGVLLYLSLLGTIISMYLWNYGNKYVSSASAAAFIYAVPLVSVAAGVLLLGERLTLPLIAGGVMILAGVALAQLVGRR